MTLLGAAAVDPADPAKPPAEEARQAKPKTEKQESTYDKIWKFAEWYESDSNPVFQRVLFSGRYQHEFALLDADQGDHDEVNIRRVRMGPRVTFLRKFTFHWEAELNPQERNPLYLRSTDINLQWNKSPRLALTFGKQAVLFTNEGATSSRELITIDRSNLANNIWFPQEYMTGVSVSGRRAPWMYRVGVYSGGAMNREFGEFNGSAFTLGVLGYDFAKALDVKEALLVGNYLYQDPNRNNTFTRQLQHIVSVNFRLDTGSWGMRTDLAAAAGYLGQSDLRAVMLMPFLNVTNKLQFVVRYTLIDSEDPNGIRLTTYENLLVTGRGDLFNELYGGVNYYFYGHKLKLQSGIAYADMDDRVNDGGTYSGLSWVTGIRVGW